MVVISYVGNTAKITVVMLQMCSLVAPYKIKS